MKVQKSIGKLFCTWLASVVWAVAIISNEKLHHPRMTLTIGTHLQKRQMQPIPSQINLCGLCWSKSVTLLIFIYWYLYKIFIDHLLLLLVRSNIVEEVSIRSPTANWCLPTTWEHTQPPKTKIGLRKGLILKLWLNDTCRKSNADLHLVSTNSNDYLCVVTDQCLSSKKIASSLGRWRKGWKQPEFVNK